LRGMDNSWATGTRELLSGTSAELLPRLALALLDKPAARRDAELVQERLELAAHFFATEAKPLRQALVASGMAGTYVPQNERDRLFLRWRPPGLGRDLLQRKDATSLDHRQLHTVR
jgi:hypothetical protein